MNAIRFWGNTKVRQRHKLRGILNSNKAKEWGFHRRKRARMSRSEQMALQKLELERKKAMADYVKKWHEIDRDTPAPCQSCSAYIQLRAIRRAEGLMILCQNCAVNI